MKSPDRHQPGQTLITDKHHFYKGKDTISF
nr:MAG TPA: hypothetical protein [Caudoviricetes sp.]